MNGWFVIALLTFKLLDVLPIDCPKSLTRFEKVLGLLPYHYTNTKLLYKSKDDEPITIQCISKCMKSEECAGFILFFDKLECYFYKSEAGNDGEIPNDIDTNTAWFTKTCLKGNVSCNRAWILERISGGALIGNDTKKLPHSTTREDCQYDCLREKGFKCRSAKFRITEDNSRRKGETLGTCTLSDSDRHLMPYSYRVSSFYDEYLDNLCLNDTNVDFCSYEEYENSFYRHVDAKYLNKTKEECQESCESITEFICRGFSLLPTSNRRNILTDRYTCLIHSEDTKIYGPNSLKYVPEAKYFERASCLNITVKCTENLMTIIYTPETNFRGKMYMQGYFEDLECYSTGSGFQQVILKIPLIQQHCGLTMAKSTGAVNKTLLSGNMVLQYNSLIQTQGDRLIRVGCIFSNDSRIVLGTGVNFTENVNNKGTAVINSTSVHPTVQLEVVDRLTQSEVIDAQIGQELQLRIEVSPADGRYDIWAGHLVAMTENGKDSILLLDDRGCPTNLHIFPALQKFQNATSKVLFANFQAFKFTSSPIVRFSVIVEFCPHACPLVNCEDNTAPHEKKKRHTSTIETINGTSVTNVTREQFFDGDNDGIIKMPLDFVIVVRNSKQVKPDRLIYGENNKILVAGYDFINNEVCFDYSLLIGLIVTWLLIQVILVTCSILIIRKYKRHYEEEYVRQSLEEIHRNFGLGYNTLDNRRVHWADRRENDSEYM